MAVDMFLKLDGITGESKDSKHKGEIDVLAWSWGASQSGSTHSGSGGGAGKVNVQDINFTKYVDKASPSLFLNCANGKHIATASLIVRKAGEHPLEYIKLDLTEVLVTHYSTGGSGGEDRITENVSLNFAKMKLTYTPQADTGAGESPVVTGWDIPANVKA